MKTTTKLLIQILMLMIAASPALADHHKEGEKMKGKAKAEMNKAMAKAKDETESHMEDAEDEAKDEVDEMKDKGEKSVSRMKDDSGDRAEKKMENAEVAKGNGNEKTAEMQARRDDMKEMKADYKESGEKVKGKKPWWKFWSDE